MKKRWLIALTAAFVIFTMACVVTDMLNQTDTEEPDLAATVAALETQLAQATLNNQPQEQAPTQPPPTAAPEPTAAPDFQFEYLSFNYDPSLASNAWGEMIPEDNPQEDTFPVQAPQHILVHFDNYIIGDHFHTPEIRVYPIPRYREISDVAVSNIDYLNQLLGSRSTTESYYPYLPFVPAGQILLAKIEYIAFEGGRGVRYLTEMGQAYAPANNHSLFYTFQGITDNGYYISVTLPIHHPDLLNSYEDVGSDWEPYYNEDAWNTYKTETEAQMNGYTDASYAPSIVLLDELVRSIQVNP